MTLSSGQPVTNDWYSRVIVSLAAIAILMNSIRVSFKYLTLKLRKIRNNQISSNIFWTLFQPVFLGTFLAASAVVFDWMDSGTLLSILLLFPIPFYLILERFHPNHKDWLLSCSDFAEDVFWVFPLGRVLKGLTLRYSNSQ
jgi:hypothetical protein